MATSAATNRKTPFHLDGMSGIFLFQITQIISQRSSAQKRPKIVNSFDEIDKGPVASANGNAGTVEFDFASNV